MLHPRLPRPLPLTLLAAASLAFLCSGATPPEGASADPAAGQMSAVPETPAASSRINRRFCGRAAINSEIWPWRTRAGELAPVEASANKSCTSRARTSRPLMR